MGVSDLVIINEKKKVWYDTKTREFAIRHKLLGWKKVSEEESSELFKTYYKKIKKYLRGH